VKYFSLELKALSPLAIRADHATGGADTAKSISGTTLAGSLAAVYRLWPSGDAKGFEALFLSGKLSYPYLYPALFKDSNLHTPDFPVYPLPKTAHSCKRFSGFQYMTEDEIEKGEKRRHGVRDELFDWTLFNRSRELSRNISDTLAIMERHKYCPGLSKELDCQQMMEAFSGYYSRLDRERLLAAQIDAHTRLQTRTGINRQSGTVEEGILYNRQVFDDGMRFWGVVRVDDENDSKLAEEFQTLLTQIGNSRLVRVGTGRTRGLGKVSLTMTPVKDEAHSLDTFKEKLVKFNNSLRQEAEAIGLKDHLQPFYFALTLHSPTILYDDLLRYRGRIDVPMLAELAGLSPELFPAKMFQLVYQTASIRRITGWNELWGTPRMNEYAIDTGSVFMFACLQPLNDTLFNTLVQSLFRLEEQGIGQCRGEGFGRVCVSDPFHREVKLV